MNIKKGYAPVIGLLQAAILSSGCGGGKSSNEPSIGLQVKPPYGPINLTTTAISHAQIDLEWQDKSNNEEKFIIERSPDGLNFSVIAEVNENIIQFSDTTLAPETTCYYRVKASNTAGDSGYSNISKATSFLYTWSKFYIGFDDDSPSSMAPTADGGYVISGTSLSFGSGDEDIWILKLAAKGEVQWQKAYGGKGDDTAKAVIQTQDGGYAVCGATTSFGAKGKDFWVLKLNSTGDVEWQKSFGGDKSDVAKTIVQTDDLGFLVGGTANIINGTAQIWLIKLKPDGAIQWQKTHQAKTWNSLHCMIKSKNNGFVLAGETANIAGGYIGPDSMVMEIDSNGEVNWATNLRLGHVSSLAQASDGGYIVARVSCGFPAGSCHLVTKLNGNGGRDWEKSYQEPNGKNPSNYNQPYSITPTSDQNYMLAGSVGNYLDQWKVCAVKIDPDGTVLWCKLYDSDHSQAPCTITQIPDGGFVIGSSKTTLNNENDYWMLKIDPQGFVAFNAASGATVIDFDWDSSDTNANSPTPVTVTITVTTESATDTTAVPIDTNCIVEEQAP